MKLLNNVDLVNAQAMNLRLHFAATPPTAALEGMLYYDTVNDRPRWKNASGWVDIYPSASANTVNTAVLRDGSGNFSAGTITAALSGNASTAASLQNSRNFSITGKATASSVGFNGTGDVSLNVTALSVACSDISLADGCFMIGLAGVGSAITKAFIPLSGFGLPNAAVNMGAQILTNLATPVSDSDAATKGYVDGIALGFDVKASVRVATTGALGAHTWDGTNNRMTATGTGALPAIDGVTLVVNDRILVKNEGGGTHLENGIYYVEVLGDGVTAWKLKRATDADSNVEVTTGLYCWIEEGTLSGDCGYILTTNNPITLNTTALTLQQFSGTGQITAGNGIVKSGNTLHFATASNFVTNAVPFASGTSTIGFTANAAGASRRVLICASGGSPDWSRIPLADGDYVTGTLAVGNGGTGLTSYAVGDLLYASGTTTLAKIAVGAAGKFLRSTGTGPAWSTATVPDTATQYDLLYASAANTWTSLAKAANTGTLVASSAGIPSWTTTTTNYQVLQRDGAGNITFGALALAQAAAVTGQLAMANGGSGANLTGSAGGIVWTPSTTAMAVLAGTATASKMLLSGASATPTWSTSTHPTAAGAAGTFVRSDGTNYGNSTLVLPNAAAAGELPYGSATNSVSMLAAGVSGCVLQCSGAGAPSWFDLFGSNNVFTAGNTIQRAPSNETWIAGLTLDSTPSSAGEVTHYSPAIVFQGHYWNVSDQVQFASIYLNPKANASAGGTGGMVHVRPLVFRHGTADAVGLYTNGGNTYLTLMPTTTSTGESFVVSSQNINIQAGTGGGAHVNGYDVDISGGNSDTSAGSTGGHLYLIPGVGDVAANNGRVDISSQAKSFRLSHLTSASRLVRVDANKDLVGVGYDITTAVTTAGRFLQVASTTSVIESPYALPTSLVANQVWVSSSTTGVTPVAITANSVATGNASNALTFLTASAYQVLRADGSGVPGFGAIALAQGNAVSGILPVANGGTGTAYFGVAGPTALRTYTFPNATCTIPRILASTVTGDGAALTRTVTHSFGTRDLQVQVYETSGSYDQVFPDIELTDTNTVTLRFLTAPANGYTYRVVIISV